MDAADQVDLGFIPRSITTCLGSRTWPRAPTYHRRYPAARVTDVHWASVFPNRGFATASSSAPMVATNAIVDSYGPDSRKTKKHTRNKTEFCNFRIIEKFVKCTVVYRSYFFLTCCIKNENTYSRCLKILKKN